MISTQNDCNQECEHVKPCSYSRFSVFHIRISFAIFLLSSTAIAQETYDIKVSDRAIVQRCVTSNSARDIAVGMPGGFNFAFDPVNCRLSYVWFGGFIDYRPEATGRGGRKVALLGAKQEVGTDKYPIRIGSTNKEPQKINFEGYRKDRSTGIPTFLFQVDGVAVEQRVISFGSDQVTIELSFPEKGKLKRLYRFDRSKVKAVEVSESLSIDKKGTIEIPANESFAQIKLTLNPSKEKFVRQEPTTNGRLLYALHCMSCHTLDGTKKIGPSFSELWTANRNITRGEKSESIKADEAYIRESILDPQAAVVQGYENANKMVDIRDTLNEKQIDALVEFLMDLKK